MRMETGGALFAVFLGALAALPPIAIDMALPALDDIANSLHTTSSLAGLTLSMFMAGFAASPVIYGPLSDRHGRRPLLLIGLVLFTIAGFAAAIAPSISLLLLARLIQGAGAGAGMTLAMAMVRDLFSGKAAQGRLAVITVVANVAPIIAPALGAGLATVIGWRGIYAVIGAAGFMTLAAIFFCLSETAPELGAKKPPLFPKLLADYRIVLGHRSTIANILINAFGFGWLFAYVSGSPLLIINTFHAGPALYSAMFACTGAGIVGGATLTGRLSHRGIPASRLLLVAVGLAVGATALLTVLSLMGHLSLLTAMPLLVVATGAFGMASPNAAFGALKSLPKQAGIAGGLLASVQMLFGAATSSLVSLLFPAYGPLAMTGTMLLCAVLALAITVPVVRRSQG